MAEIKALKAYRLQQQWASEVAALPYDVMTTEEARKMITGHPYSFLNIDKPELHTNQSEEAAYLYVANQLKEMINKGLYVQDPECLYIYEIESVSAHQYGLVGLVSTDEYELGIIKKHENTRIDKEEDRVQHILHCQAHTGPVFLVENELPDFGEQMIRYAASHTPIINVQFDDHISHRIYQISDTQILHQLIEQFKGVRSLYIADGHHRAAAAYRVAKKLSDNEEAQHFLAVIFPKEQLHILAYHRLVQEDKHMTKEQFFQQLEQIFEIKAIGADIYLPNEKHTFGMRYQGKWYELICSPELYQGQSVMESLDAAILQKFVLLPLFGIEKPKNDPRIDFLPGIRNAHELNERTKREDTIAFSLYPTSMEELLAVADARGLMPPKSTWFEPKLRSGFFIHCF